MQDTILHEWPVLDRLTESVVSSRTLLPDISEVQLTFYDRNGQPRNTWVTKVADPPGWLANYPGAEEFPQAVEWRFIHPRYGEMIWLFKVNENNYASTQTPEAEG